MKAIEALRTEFPYNSLFTFCLNHIFSNEDICLLCVYIFVYNYRIDESHRDPTECLKYPVSWLSLASLCVLDKEHVDGLSSGEYNEAAASRPTCDNHDDGETLAIILCDICGNLCVDCDRYLHLHRKTKAHQRQVFKVSKLFAYIC